MKLEHLKPAFFIALSLLYFWLTIMAWWLLEVLSSATRPAPLSWYFLVFAFLAVAVGCVWLAMYAHAWSGAFYVPRAIILIAVALTFTSFGVLLIRGEINEWQGDFVTVIGVFIIWVLPIFTVAGGCLWAALPQSWKRRVSRRREFLDPS